MLFSPILRVPAGAAAPLGGSAVSAGVGTSSQDTRRRHGSVRSAGTAEPTVEVTLELDQSHLAETAASVAQQLECVSAASAPASSSGKLRVWLKPSKGVPLKELIARVLEELRQSGISARRAEPSSSGKPSNKTRRRS